MADDSSDSSQLDPTGADSKASLFERILGVTNSLAQVGGIAEQPAQHLWHLKS
jgi:hypothetical protein